MANVEQPIYPKLQLKQYENLAPNGLALSTDMDGNLTTIPAGGGGGSSKQPKSIPGSAMPADNVYVYTINSGDITALGQSIKVAGFMVNNGDFYPSYVFSGNQGALVAGDTISFSGLPAKADVTIINFDLI